MNTVLTYPSDPAISGEQGALNLVDKIWVWLRAYLSALRVSSYDYDAVCPHCGGLMRLPTDVLNEALIDAQQVYRDRSRKRLTPTQCLEWLCRLSPWGRIDIYKLGIRRKILCWRKAAQRHEQSRSLWAQTAPLCGATLSPD